MPTTSRSDWSDADVAVFVDGPVHDQSHIQQKDAAAERKLEDNAWLVIRFGKDKSTWPATIAKYPHVFGAGKKA